MKRNNIGNIVLCTWIVLEYIPVRAYDSCQFGV